MLDPRRLSRILFGAACLLVWVLALRPVAAQDDAHGDPHASGAIVAPAGKAEVAYCLKCHTAGCPMPHPELVQVNWPVAGRANLADGFVTCGSCHTANFRHRDDAFLAADQKGLCYPCHNGAHALPNAHPFGTPCTSCHTAPKASLVGTSPAAHAMVATIDAECLRCHYDGPITHPVGIPNTKIQAPDLPLSAEGKITCVTCHYGHDNQNIHGQLLRKDNRRGALCLSCHNDL